MFGVSQGVRLEKREERGLVRTRTLRRWGIPKTPRTFPVNAQNPGHDGGAGLQPEVHFILRHSNHRRAMLRRCSLLMYPEGASPAGVSARHGEFRTVHFPP